MNTNVWLVTGASKGLGLSLVQELLTQGYRVAATSRSREALEAAVGPATEEFLPLQVDLLDEGNVAAAVDRAVQAFGNIDVVVNNAGYGQLGTLEELTDRETRQNFDVNVFGTLNVIRAVMPLLREQRAGHVINLSSVGGFVGNFPGWGVYCATKFAVVGLTEALSAEAKEFGISATVVYPGYFRTEFLDGGSLNLPRKAIAAYSEARKLEAAHVTDIRGNQPGDPQRAARTFIELAESKTPPLHFFMGSDAYAMAGKQLAAIAEELKAHAALSKSTDFTPVSIFNER